MSSSALGILVAVIPLSLVVFMLWVSVKAAPLQGRPYRWGTYIGCTSALAALSFALVAVASLEDNNVAGVVIAAFMAVSFGVCGVGLMRRRKFGVVAFFIAYITLVFLPPVLDVVWKSERPIQPRNSLAVVLYTCVTAVYLIKRWDLLEPRRRERISAGDEAAVDVESQTKSVPSQE